MNKCKQWLIGWWNTPGGAWRTKHGSAHSKVCKFSTLLFHFAPLETCQPPLCELLHRTWTTFHSSRSSYVMFPICFTLIFINGPHAHDISTVAGEASRQGMYFRGGVSPSVAFLIERLITLHSPTSFPVLNVFRKRMSKSHLSFCHSCIILRWPNFCPTVSQWLLDWFAKPHDYTVFHRHTTSHIDTPEPQLAATVIMLFRSTSSHILFPAVLYIPTWSAFSSNILDRLIDFISTIDRKLASNCFRGFVSTLFMSFNISLIKTPTTPSKSAYRLCDKGYR